MSDLGNWLLLVDATVEPQVEEEWNRWYDEIHLPEITACPGFRWSARYVSDTGGARRYVSIYGVDSPDTLQTPEFRARRGWAQFAPNVDAATRLFRRVQ
jgi:antibiotic biosynthesis monooxygenase (ABM) superfamily enzyme